MAPTPASSSTCCPSATGRSAKGTSKTTAWARTTHAPELCVHSPFVMHSDMSLKVANMSSTQSWSSAEPCGSNRSIKALCFSGSNKNRNHKNLGSKKRNSTSLSSHMVCSRGTRMCKRCMAATKSDTASRMWTSVKYRMPASQHSSHATSRATRTTLLQRCGSTSLKDPSACLKYSRKASKEATTSAARSTAGWLPLEDPPGPGSADSLNHISATSNTSASKSSLPFRCEFATEFNVDIARTRLRLASWAVSLPFNLSSFSFTCSSFSHRIASAM
mmetsp:Transcript_17617/g.40765  ORF Transcript_17617/g.40765 Transcript_17617/m.40765 type:complete len:275 (+) Transcript_17617:221-1045(+)